MNKDAEKRPVWNFAFNYCCAFDEYQLMYQVLNIRPHPSFRFIHEEHTSSKSSYSVVTNARGIYLIVVIVVAPSDSQRVIKRQQGLMDAKQLKEQFRLANINNEKVNDEAIARAADENYLVNKQVIDEVYLEASRPVMDLQEEMSHKDELNLPY
ncbi:hypothetical protein RhiirA5_413576 [Rhizophagus irregularis]|uniref:Uncharacterized protein n=1 Tax=Rhizophagus irregularis TaxID=588596 RepID=A0A2N0PW52_9GLOM|nr:hypothetical protein RhiirA5_413576 [Rhizophagus irregularis]